MADKFKLVKKQKEKYYIAPSSLAGTAYIMGVSESGIFFHGNEKYSKVFKLNERNGNVSSLEKIKGTMMILRSYDIPFRYIEKNNEMYLYIELTAKDFNSAYDMFGHITEEIQNGLYTFGTYSEAVSTQKRLQLIHRGFIDNPNKRFDVNDYMLKPSSWLPDFSLKSYNAEPKFVIHDEKVRSLFFMRKIPTENIGTLYSMLKETEGIEQVILDYEPVSDQDVILKTSELYAGVKIDVPEENERRYIFAGIYAEIVGTDKNRLIDTFNNLRNKIEPYRCDVSYYLSKQLPAYQGFLTFNTHKIKQLRLIKVENAVKCTPLDTDKKVEDLEAEFFEFCKKWSEENES